MAPKPSPDSLIHCSACGEDYSATYKRCPFCGAKNSPSSVPPAAPAPSRGGDDLDDGYVFDGQDLFDEDPGEDDRPVRPKGGKRLADKPSNPFISTPVNWPRLITFLCSLIIIIAALVIVFTVIYPQLRGANKPPVESDPPSSPTEPAVPTLPAVSNPGTVDTDPPVDPSAPAVEPPVGTLTKLTLNRDDFTLRPGGTFQLVPTFFPADWSGTVTWSISPGLYASVGQDGTVTHTSQDNALHREVVTASAGGLQVECVVFIAGPLEASQPPASEPPAQASTPPASQAPSGGTVTVGKQGVIVNADSGLRVRSGPGTTYEVVSSLVNGSVITVVAKSDGDWYQISFAGSGGATINGYIMGEYISTP